MIIFRKSIACPTSETLLAYQQDGRLSGGENGWVESHLGCCDFCRAELQLLKRYRSVTERLTLAEIPVALRELATSLLASMKTGGKPERRALN